MQSSDQLFEGKIWRRDGTSNPVRSIHKTMADYFQALAAAGWSTLPRLEELSVQDHHLTLDPQFFGPLEGLPLHLLFELQR
jgi:hypothetical protein